MWNAGNGRGVWWGCAQRGSQGAGFTLIPFNPLPRKQGLGGRRNSEWVFQWAPKAGVMGPLLTRGCHLPNYLSLNGASRAKSPSSLPEPVLSSSTKVINCIEEQIRASGSVILSVIQLVHLFSLNIIV